MLAFIVSFGGWPRLVYETCCQAREYLQWALLCTSTRCLYKNLDQILSESNWIWSFKRGLKFWVWRGPGKKKISVFKKGEKDLPRVYDPSPKYCVVMLGAPAAPSGDPNMLVQQLGSWLSFRMSLAIVCWCRAEGRALEQAWSTASLMLVMGALGFCCLFFVFTFWFFV